MDEADIKKMIMEKQSNQRISCKSAIEVAEKTGLPKRKIGQLLDDLKIKIVACQLGCFD